jgi:hypothetical protein
VLRKKTVEKVIRGKIQQILFKELGLTDDIRYAVFLANLEKLNRQRQKALYEGRVIYGPVQYSTLQYYGHWMATMQIQAKEKLRKEQFDVTEPKLRDYYTRNKERFKSSGSLTLETLAVHREQGTNSQSSRIDTVSDEIILKVRQGSTFEGVAHEYKGRKYPNVLFQMFEMIDDARLGELFPDEAHFKQIHSLIPGQVIKFSDAQDRMWIVKCVSIIASDYLPYEHIRNLLEQRYVDTEYDRLIEKRIQNAYVEIIR